jgi:hypothetical protein
MEENRFKIFVLGLSFLTFVNTNTVLRGNELHCLIYVEAQQAIGRAGPFVIFRLFSGDRKELHPTIPHFYLDTSQNLSTTVFFQHWHQGL